MEYDKDKIEGYFFDFSIYLPVSQMKEEKMKKILILVLAIIIWRFKYILTSGIIPKIGFIKRFINLHELVSGSLIVQFSMLLIAILLIIIIGKGKFSEFGFKGAKISIILKAILVAFVTSLVLFVLNAVHMVKTNPSIATGGSFLGNSFLQNIIMVWIIASSVEEIFYRGFLQTFMAPLKDYGIKLKKIFISIPVIAAAIMFGLMHFCLWDIIPHRMVYFIIINATVLGLIAGYYREKTGSLIPAYFVHLTFNVVGMTIPQIMMMGMK